MDLASTENQRANLLTGISITLTLVLVIITFQIKITAIQCLYLVIGGLISYTIANLIGKTLLKAVLERRIWALFLTKLLMTVVTISISIYMTGIIVLILKGIKTIWSLIL